MGYMTENLTECPVCHNDSTAVCYDRVSDELLCNSRGTFSIAKCDSCEHVFTSKRVFEDDIIRFYEKYYTQDNSERHVVYKLVRSLILRLRPARVPYPSGSGNFLSIGCGSGVSLVEYSMKGWKVFGIDFDQNALGIAAGKCPSAKLSAGELEESIFGGVKFDYIELSHVLEHIYDLNQFVEKLKVVSNPECIIKISVPDYESFERKLFGRYWRGLELPRHIHHFSFKTLTSLFPTQFFTVRSIERASLPMCFAESLCFAVRARIPVEEVFFGKLCRLIYILVYVPHKLFAKYLSGNTIVCEVQLR